MTRGGFRHVIVLKSGDAVGILSMRDIVRCWLTEGAACDVTPQSATAWVLPADREEVRATTRRRTRSFGARASGSPRIHPHR